MLLSERLLVAVSWLVELLRLRWMMLNTELDLLEEKGSSTVSMLMVGGVYGETSPKVGCLWSASWDTSWSGGDGAAGVVEDEDPFTRALLKSWDRSESPRFRRV